MFYIIIVKFLFIYFSFDVVVFLINAGVLILKQTYALTKMYCANNSLNYIHLLV